MRQCGRGTPRMRTGRSRRRREGSEEEGEEGVPWRGSRCLRQVEGGEGRAVLRHIGDRNVGELRRRTVFELTAAPVR